MGTQQIMDWQIVATGTYTAPGGDAFTNAQLGFDVVDFITAVVDGNGAQTNGVAIVAPNLTAQKWQLFGDGGVSGTTFQELSNGTLITGFQFLARVYGVA